MLMPPVDAWEGEPIESSLISEFACLVCGRVSLDLFIVQM